MSDGFGTFPYRRLLMSCGAALLGLMLLVAAFSLGVYVGETKAGNRPTLGAMMGVPQAPAKPGAGGDAGLPADVQVGQPTLVGAVLSLAEDTLTVRTVGGPRLVSIDDATTVRHRDGRRATTSDLARDTRVAVYGDEGTNGRRVRAHLVVILPE